MTLTKNECDRLRPKTKSYKKFDGEGLYLEIMPSGSKLWRLKYRYGGKEKRLSFGPYPRITLKEAREKKRKAKLILDDGKNPSLEIKNQKRQLRSQDFKVIALEWYDIKKSMWSEGHAQNVMKRLTFDIFPVIGSYPISQIRPPDVLEILRNIEKRNALEVVKKTRQICGQVFQYGIQTGRCNDNPCIHLQGATRKRKVKHYASIDTKEIPKFLDTLRYNEMRLYPRTRRAIKLSMLFFVRPGELRHACWQDIDLDHGEWIIPGEFMKSRVDHIVPLSKQAIEILEEQQRETGHFNTPWVFPGHIHPHKPMSEITVGRAIERLGYKGRMTAHGFRALARTTIREKLKYYPDIIEAQLAHKPSGPLGAAYDRAQFLDDRKQMMQDWADYIDGLADNIPA